MKSFAVAALLLCSGAAWSAEKPAPVPAPAPGPKPGDDGACHPQPPHPECVKGEEAKDTFDKLDVEPKVITHDKVTITIKRSKGITCREVASEKSTEYVCCVRPAPKPDAPKPGEPKPTEVDSLIEL